MTRTTRHCLLTVLVALSYLGVPSSTQASLQLRILNSSNSVIFSSSTGGTSIAVSGPFSDGPTNYSNFTVSVTSNTPGGTGSPANNNLGRIRFSGLTIDADNAGKLTFQVTSDNFNIPTPTPGSFLKSRFSSGATYDGNVVISSQSYADAANGNTFSTVGTTTTGPQILNGGNQNTTLTTPFSYSGQYSLLEIVTINFGAGGGSITFSSETDVIAPEPSTLALAFAGLPVIGLLGWRNRRQRRADCV